MHKYLPVELTICTARWNHGKGILEMLRDLTSPRDRHTRRLSRERRSDQNWLMLWKVFFIPHPASKLQSAQLHSS